MRSNKFLLFLTIALEVITVFCLGILSDQISNLLTLPATFLIIISGVGILGIVLITYMRYTHAPEKLANPKQNTRLTFWEIVQRLKPN
jgi:hypothetical protein